MYVMFFKAKHGGIFHKLIALWTGGPYSHCELYLPKYETAFSSRHDTGCTFKNIELYDNRYDVIKIPKIYSQSKAYELCQELEGSEYDWAGIFLNFILPINEHSRRRYFCSEVCIKLLLASGLNLGLTTHKTSPNKLYEALMRFKCRDLISSKK